jgi:topoisomerase-4 subunit A
MIAKLKDTGKRRSKVEKFAKVNIKELNRETLELRYDRAKGYIGTGVDAEPLLTVDSYDRIFVLRKNASFIVKGFSQREYVGEDCPLIVKADKAAIAKLTFTVIYLDAETGFPLIKRFTVDGWINNRDYQTVPENARVLHIDTRAKFSFTISYKAKPRLKLKEETFKAQDYAVRGIRAGGIRLSNKEAEAVSVK